MRPMCGDRAAVDSPDVLGGGACEGAGYDVASHIPISRHIRVCYDLRSS